MTRSTPTVRNNRLFYQTHQQEYTLTVGTESWYTWLATATSFTFNSSHGSFTARKNLANNKQDGEYWKAYSKRRGKLLHAYLGKSEQLSLEQLQTVAIQLSQQVHGEQIAAQTKTIFPTQPTPLIGREQETTNACALLQRSDVRLVTISGPGGVGKTSLTLQILPIIEEDFPGGISYVSLGPISDAALVLPTIAQELGLVEAGSEPLIERIATYLRDKHSLLILDNFEQVMAAAPLLAELLLQCPHLKILATSREALHLRGEYEFVVPCLTLPDLQQLPANGDFSHYPAIQLFAQRAAAVKGDFTITPANAAVIAEICTRLDGLPLALELGAARIKHLSPNALLSRLEHRLHVLTSGARDLPKRQQTLRDTLAWSYDLLSPDEQKIFRSLSIFVRGCTLTSAEAFCMALQETDDCQEPAIFDTIASLIDKSLLQQIEQPDGNVRLSMLGTIREYGQECLKVAGEAEKTAHIHAFHYLALAEQAEPELRKSQQAQWLKQLEQENDNLRAALRWFIERDGRAEREGALRLCSSLWRFWLIRNRQKEGYQWADKALVMNENYPISPAVQAKAFFVTAALADSQDHYEHSLQLWQKSLALYEQLDDQAGVAATLNKLGTTHARNAPAEARILFQRSLSLARFNQDHYEIADAIASLAEEAFARGLLSEARTAFEERLAISRTLGDTRSIAYCLDGLGQIAAHTGNYAQASLYLKECLELHREIDDRIGIAFALLPLAIVTLYQGNYNMAQTLLNEFRMVTRELGNQHNITSPGTLRETTQFLHIENTPTSQILAESIALFKETGNDKGIATKLFALGCIEFAQGNFNEARKSFDESLDLFQHLGNRAMTAAALNMQGHLEAHQGRYANAHRRLEESLVITREIDDSWLLCSRLTQLSLIALNEGDHVRAQLLIKESVVATQKIGDSRYIAEALHVQGLISLYSGDYATALKLLNETLALNSEMRSGSIRAYLLADLGVLAFLQNNISKAKTLIEESLALCIHAGDKWFIASCLERLGEIQVKQGQPESATRLWGTAAAMRTAISAPMPPIETALYQSAITIARQQLGEQRFAACWNIGHDMTLEQVLASLQVDATSKEFPAGPIGDSDIKKPVENQQTAFRTAQTLTNREKEVLRLTANGFTNIQIAEKLVISPRTVQTHLSTIYTKIGVTSRSAATRYVIENHLD